MIGDPLIAGLRARIDRTLDGLITAGTPCALVDFPNHSNVGDHALWLGERALLRQRACPVVYACAFDTYDPDALAERLRGGVILIHGGGNLGDLWPRHQELRECVVADFPDARIIQLPQSIAFEHDENLGRARAIFDRHPDLTLLVRDRASLALARANFAARSELCPDLAFALDGVERPRAPEVPILWVERDDAESLGLNDPPDGSGVERSDWILDGGYEHIEPHLDTYDAIAASHLDRGCRMLARGRVVVTDRLHAHVLCLFMGIPHVAMDNSYGKVGNFIATWMGGHPLVRWANSPVEALAVARGLAHTPVSSGAAAPWPVHQAAGRPGSA